MERDLIKKLIEWKDRNDKKPLLLKGVRQCGKTHLLKVFGERYYEDVAYFNFEEADGLKTVFDVDYNVDRIIFELGLYRGKTINEEGTLVILDEIQICSRAVTSLKYFCENPKKYHVVCAGSLLGVAINRNSSFPVGKVEFLNLYPLSFSEFVRAMDGDLTGDFVEKFKTEDKLPSIMAEKLERLLREYYLTGGMPEVVKAWHDTRDIKTVETIQQNILNSYELDFAKHAPIKDFPKLSAIWRSIPEQLARENSKFIFSHVKKGWRSKDLEDALEWLVGAGLVYKVRRIEKPFIPLSSYADDTVFKLYMADIGLLRRLSKLPHEAIISAIPLYKEFKGAMTENFALCALIQNGVEDAYYWTSGNTAEVDFVIQSGIDIIPIEVKSERNTKSRSLAEYKKKYNPSVSVKTSMKKEVNNGEILNIPLYLLNAILNLEETTI